MPVSASQASLIPYWEEGSLALASAGEGCMGMATPTLAGMDQAPLAWDMAILTMAWATSHPMGIHINIREFHYCQDELRVAKAS